MRFGLFKTGRHVCGGYNINKLHQSKYGITRWYVDKKDGARLFDGMYSSILYAASALVSGCIDNRFYGIMNETETNKPSVFS